MPVRSERARLLSLAPHQGIFPNDAAPEALHHEDVRLVRPVCLICPACRCDEVYTREVSDTLIIGACQECGAVFTLTRVADKRDPALRLARPPDQSSPG